MATSGNSHGYSWRYSTPVVDTMAQAKAAGITAYGLGDDSHWNGSGDHVSKPSTGHAGWITAVDLMAGSGYNPVDHLDAYLLPRCKAGLEPTIKYLITDYRLYDARYGWARQSGGDGPDHLHISFNNSYSARASLFKDYQAWKTAGRPNPVTFKAGDAGVQEDQDVSVVQLANGRAALLCRGTNDAPYVRVITMNGEGTELGWRKLANTTVGSSLSGVSPDGTKLVLATLHPTTKAVRVFLVDDVTKEVPGVRALELGGKGFGTPDVAVDGDRLVVTVVGDKNVIYLNTSDDAGDTWRGFWDTSGKGK